VGPSPLKRAPQRLRFPAAWIAAVLVLAGCGGGGAGRGGPAGTVVGVTERDFHIATTLAAVRSGQVTLRIHEQGPDEHELIVAPERNHGLPMRSDGFTVNEEAIQNSEPGSINPQEPGVTRYLTMNLAPGRYVLFCNMEGHYMAGMHVELRVS